MHLPNPPESPMTSSKPTIESQLYFLVAIHGSSPELYSAMNRIAYLLHLQGGPELLTILEEHQDDLQTYVKTESAKLNISPEQYAKNYILSHSQNVMDDITLKSFTPSVSH